jgi:hypothetical protein
MAMSSSIPPRVAVVITLAAGLVSSWVLLVEIKR